VDRPRRRHDEERWQRELSGCRVLSDFVCQMVPAEQRGRDLRVRGGRPGEQSLPVLGMEVGKPADDVTNRCELLGAWFVVARLNPKASIERKTNQFIRGADREITSEFKLRGGTNGSSNR
jgi:hypothetical protein